jgi:hypothetical protein
MRSVALATLFLSAALFAQEDQRPRPPVKNDRGLLQVNRDYYDLAASTGGDIYFWAPGEFATAKLRVPIDREPVALSYGNIESKKVFDIPIESGVEQLTLFVAVQRKDLATLLRPNGTAARDRDRGVDLQPFQHMLIATIASPAAGVWHLELQGAGMYAFTAHVKPSKDAADFVGFDFVEPGGRPGHEGMFPINREVNAGETIVGRISLSGALKEPQLDFVTRDGALIRTFAMTAVSDDEYQAQCTIPTTPFRVVVRGIDSSGARFQRTESKLHMIRPSS